MPSLTLTVFLHGDPLKVFQAWYRFPEDHAHHFVFVGFFCMRYPHYIHTRLKGSGMHSEGDSLLNFMSFLQYV